MVEQDGATVRMIALGSEQQREHLKIPPDFALNYDCRCVFAIDLIITRTYLARFFQLKGQLIDQKVNRVQMRCRDVPRAHFFG